MKNPLAKRGLLEAGWWERSQVQPARLASVAAVTMARPGKADGAAASFVVVAELGEGGEAVARGDVEELEGAAAKQPVGTRDEELCCGRRRR